MDKYVELLSNLNFDLLHIEQSYANDNNSPLIEPAHLLRALLHKSAGLRSIFGTRANLILLFLFVSLSFRFVSDT